MAVNSTTYVLNHKAILESHGCDEALETLISDINHYLFHFSQSWIFYFAHNYYFRCYRSWVHVQTHLEVFLRDPKFNYSMLMYVLEHERTKFPSNSYYGKKLKELSQLIATGPEFYFYSLR